MKNENYTSDSHFRNWFFSWFLAEWFLNKLSMLQNAFWKYRKVFLVVGIISIGLVPIRSFATEYYAVPGGGDISTVSNTEYTGEIFKIETFVNIATASIYWYNVAPPVKQYYADFIIMNEAGQTLTSYGNFYVGNDYGISGQNYVIDFPDINLAPGFYFIGVKMATSTDTGIRRSEYYSNMGAKTLALGESWFCEYDTLGNKDCSEQFDNTYDIGFRITGSARYSTSTDVVWSDFRPTSTYATSGIYALCQSESYMVWYEPSTWFTSSTIRMIGCTLFMPTGGLTFINNRFDELQDVFPFTIFFNFRNMLYSYTQSYDSTNQSFNLPLGTTGIGKLGSTTVTYSSGSLSNLIGSESFNLAWEFEEMLIWALLGYAIIRLIL